MRAALQVKIAGDSPPRCVVCAIPPPGPPIDESSAMAPMIATKYFAGTGKTKYMQIGRSGKYIA